MLTNVDNYLSVLPTRHELQSKTPAHRDKESCGLPKLSTQRSGIFTFCQVYPKFTCFLSWLFLAAIIHARTHTTHCVRASVLPRASFPLSASTRTLHAPSASPKKKKKKQSDMERRESAHRLDSKAPWETPPSLCKNTLGLLLSVWRALFVLQEEKLVPPLINE